MSFELPGANTLDEQICRYAGSKLQFRGPCANLDDPYLAFLGSSETYGKFVREPFTDLVDRRLRRTCVNLGCVNAGLDTILNDSGLMRIAAGADMTVIQVPGAQDLTNRFYRVHPRRNDRFLEPTPMLTALYGEVDFTEFHFNKHMLSTLHRVSPGRFTAVRDELRRIWLARMRQLIRALGGRVLLLWLPYADGSGADSHPLGADPLLVTRTLLDRLVPDARGVLEVPVKPAGATCETDKMVFGPLQAPLAEHLIGPGMHRQIADRVAEALSRAL